MIMPVCVQFGKDYMIGPMMTSSYAYLLLHHLIAVSHMA